eukprot:2831115-Pyramimonas_sp.AAC.1
MAAWRLALAGPTRGLIALATGATAYEWRGPLSTAVARAGWGSPDEAREALFGHTVPYYDDSEYDAGIDGLEEG